MQNIIFRDNNGYKQRLSPPVPKWKCQFFDLFSRARVLKREKNNGKGDSASEPSQFASLSEGEMQQILKERHSGKTKQKRNWSVSTFKGKHKFFCFEIVKLKLLTRAFNRKIEIKAISTLLNSFTANNHFWYCCPFFASDLMHNSTGYVIKQLVHAFSCALSSYGALGKFEEHSRSKSCPWLSPQATLTLLSCSPNFPRAP